MTLRSSRLLVTGSVFTFLTLGLLSTPVFAQVSAPEERVSKGDLQREPAVLAVAADRPKATYAKGEEVAFLIELKAEGATEDVEISWVLSKDGMEPQTTGKVKLEGGKAVVKGQLHEAGFLQCLVTCHVNGKELKQIGAAAVAPLEISASLPVPDDFDDFWAEKKAALAAVPVNARLKSVSSNNAALEVFDVQADCIGAPVSGYLARPKGAAPKSLPAILTLHGAGVRSASIEGATAWAKEGILSFNINAHGLPNGLPEEFYKELADGELKDYRVRGRQSRDSIYFLGMFLRVIRAIDVLAQQPEWDGRTIIAYGTSQGGAQSMAAAGLDSRVTFFVAGVPAMCDLTGRSAGRVAGWPRMVPMEGDVPNEKATQAVRYVDGMNMLTRAKAPGFFTVGFIDTTCPPTTVYAAFNSLQTKKAIYDDIHAGHVNTPKASQKMRRAVYDHIKAQAR